MLFAKIGVFAESMETKDVISGYSLVTLNGFSAPIVLDGEVLPYGACAISNECMCCGYIAASFKDIAK